MPKKITKAERAADEQLLAALNRHPELKERVVAIVRLANGQDSSAQTADEMETLLLAEVRRLGQQAMGQWAQGQAAEVQREIQAAHPRIHRSKKNV